MERHYTYWFNDRYKHIKKKNGTCYKVIEIAQDVATLYQVNDKDEQVGETFTMTPQEVGENVIKPRNYL